MAEEMLLDALVADGIDLGPDPDDTLADLLDEDAELVMPLADERWAWLPALLDGRIFTHRLSAVEVEHDVMMFGPDLAPLAMLTESQVYQRLTDGSPVADVSPFLDGDLLAGRGVPEAAIGDDGALLFEPGCLAALGVAAGDLAGLRVTAWVSAVCRYCSCSHNGYAPGSAAAWLGCVAAGGDLPVHVVDRALRVVDGVLGGLQCRLVSGVVGSAGGGIVVAQVLVEPPDGVLGGRAGGARRRAVVVAESPQGAFAVR